jgi:hypothetical protein
MNTDFKYTLEFYNLLEENSSQKVIDGVPLIVFQGATTKMFRAMGVSQSYYSKIVAALKDLGCITVLKRGARGVDSLVALHHRPNEMEFLVRSKSDLTDTPQAARITQQIDKVARAVGGGDFDVVAAIENLDRRVKELERGLREVLNGKET